MRFMLVAVLALLTACDQPAAPTSVPAVPTPTETVTGPSWEATVAVADDERRAPVERISALQTFLASPAGVRSPHADTARKMLGREESRRLWWGAWYATGRQMADAEAAHLRRRALAGDLASIAGIVVWEVVRQTSEYPSEDTIEAFNVVGPAGEPLTVTSRPDYVGLGYVRSVVGRLMAQSADSSDSKRWSKAGTSTWATNLALNDLLRPHLGEDLFDEKHPGRLNAEAVKTLVAKSDALVDDGLAGIPTERLRDYFGPRLREYDQTYRALKKIGFNQVVREYRAAYDKHEAGKPPGEYREGMMDFYYDWSTEHGLFDENDPALWTRPVAVGFWMRRLDDGTADTLHRALQRFVD